MDISFHIDKKKHLQTHRTMTTNLIALLLTVIICQIHFSFASRPLCAAVCHCDNSEDDKFFKMDCSRSDLSIVPPIDDWELNVTHIDFSTNHITELGSELSHDTLQELDLSNNQIRTVTQSAFGGLKNLKYLNLANNQIRNFEDNGFYGLDHLKSLNISSNGLKSLPDDIFYNFLGLQELSLSDNPLVHLDPLHFNRMIALKWLDISNIEAYTLPPSIFHTTLQLEFLDLSGNDFHDVPTEALRSAPNLKYLKLSENPIDYFDKKSFIKLNTIRSLELNTMDRLTKVMERTFSDMLNLTRLEMKYNKKLSEIHPLAFDGLFNMSRSTLQELDMEGNQLHSLSENLVKCARMRKFNVQQNPLFCDCNILWLKKCHIQIIYSADLKCQSPISLSGALVLDLEDGDFECPELKRGPSWSGDDDDSHREHVMRSVTIGVGAGFLVVLAVGLAVIFKWRSIRSWYKYGKKGPGAVYYVRARANPREI